MSSFLVSDSVYAAVAKFLASTADETIRAVFLNVGFVSAVEFVECMRLANHKGQHEKYRDPMPRKGELEALDVYGAPDLSPVQVVKHLNCIAYQACEWSGWDKTMGPLVEQICELTAEQIINDRKMSATERGMLQLQAERKAVLYGTDVNNITYVQLVRCMREYDAADWG